MRNNEKVSKEKGNTNIKQNCVSFWKSGDGGIRTLVPRRANAFRVRPVMTTSIQLHMIFSALTDIFLIIAFLLEKSSDNSP